MIKLGNNEVTKAYLGSTEVKKICLGSEQVWPVESALPYDAEVEYLESTAGAYIDTGIKASGNLHIKTYLVDYFSENNLGRWSFGGRNAYNNKAFGLYINANTNKVDQAYYNTTTARNLYSSYPQSCWVEMKGGSLKIDNTTHTFAAKTFTSSYNFILFGLQNGTSVVSGGGIKMATTYIDNSTVNLELIPVRLGQVGYMYDKVSGQLFGNAGTGSFILGNDVN